MRKTVMINLLRRLAFLAAILLAPGLVLAAETAPLTMKLSAPQMKVDATKGVEVEITFTNPGGETLHVLSWHTPIEGLMDDIFTVSLDGGQVPYIGPMVKRGSPSEGEYVSFSPGQSRTYKIDLTEGYEFAKPGRYEIGYSGGIGHFSVGPAAQPIERSEPKLRIETPAAAETISIQVVTGRAAIFRDVAPPVAGVDATPTFTNCSADQQNQTKRALSGAQWLAQAAELALFGTPMDICPTARRYETWFGAYDQTRLNSLRKNFERISDALDNQTVSFDCSCSKPNTYAYVYANSPYKIYLCPAFWTAPMVGTDSKAGTIVHEMSHFTVVAGTKDYAYGQTNARNLAKTSPDWAVMNADNYEFFNENTPPVPMP